MYDKPLFPERPPREDHPRADIVDDEEDSDDAASASSEERAPVVIPLPPRATIHLPLLDPMQLLRLPHQTAVRERFSEVFVVDEIGSVPLPRLLEVRRYIQSIPNVESFFDAIPLAKLTQLSINIVETILHLVDDLDDINETIIRHVKQYINFLFTCGNKSSRFRSTFEKHSVFHWLGMLRFPSIRNDIIFSLTFFTDNLVVLYSDDNFMHWISQIVSCFANFNENAEQKLHIVNYIMKLMELYPFFLLRCYEGMSRGIFDDLLIAFERGVKNITKNEGLKKPPPVTRSCVYYLVKFFDIAIDDMNEDMVECHVMARRIVHLMESISFVIKHIPSHHRVLAEVPALMHNLCQMQIIVVMGDEILKSMTPLHQQQMIRRQGITFNRNLSRRLPSLNSEERVDLDDCYGLSRSNTMPTDGPPDRKYARRSIEQESIENHPLTSLRLYPLPSIEILEYDLTTGFRSKDYLLGLYRARKVTPMFITTLKKAIIRLIGSLCTAVPEYRDICAEYGLVDSVFKATGAADTVRGDYLVIAKNALIEMCTHHEMNIQSLKDIEPMPAHPISKQDVMERLIAANGNAH